METLRQTTPERHASVPARPIDVAGPPARARYVDAVVDDYLDASDSEGLLEYWRVLRRHKATILVGAFLGTLLGFLVSLPQTPIYRARTAIEIETFNENYLNLREVNPTTAGGSVASELDISTQVKVLESRSLVEKVVDRLRLHERPEFQHAPTRLASWRRALGVPESPLAPIREQALEVAAGNFHVVPSRRTRIVEIFSEWPDPELAAEFANTLAETFIEHNLETRWKSTQRSGEWLTKQLEELRVKLEQSEEKLQQYARISGLLFASEKESVAEQRLRQLQLELSKAEADRIGKQSRFEIANTSLPESLPDILDNGPLGTYQLKLADLRRQLAELSARFTSAHPKFKAVQVQIDQLDTVVAKERAHILGRIRNEYETARRREKLLRNDYANQSRFVAEQGSRAIQYNIYRREVETSRQLYDNLLQRVKEAGVASAMRASNIRIIDPAKPPRSPHKPNHILNALLGLLSGTLLGIVFVFVGERADRTLKQPGDATQHLRVPELGVIPSSTRDKSPELRSNAALIFARHCQNELFVTNAMRDPNPAVRASALEGLGMADRTPDPEVLSEAFSDPNPRVQANAILAYRRIDENAAFKKLEEMARHQNADFRAIAAWAMGETQAARFVSLLKRMQQDRTSEVRRKADEALSKIRADESSIPSAVPEESAGFAAFNIEPLYAVADETSLRRLYLAVTDSEGSVVAGLSHQDFQLQEDGSTVNGQEVWGPARCEPAAIAYVLDCSGSMSASAIHEMNTAVIKSLSHKRADDRVAIVKFSMDVERAVGLTDNLKHLKAVAQRKYMGLRTSSRLHDAVEEALEEVAKQSTGCRAVIAIADGPDRGSESNLHNIVGKARDIAAPLYVVGFGLDARVGSLPDLAELTGGRFFRAADGDELASVCGALMRKISARYTLTYHGSDSHPEAIQVRVTTQTGRGETSISPLGPWS